MASLMDVPSGICTLKVLIHFLPYTLVEAVIMGMYIFSSVFSQPPDPFLLKNPITLKEILPICISLLSSISSGIFNSSAIAFPSTATLFREKLSFSLKSFPFESTNELTEKKLG